MNSLQQFKQLAASRFSCRRYLAREVPAEVLTDILECARIAPSACNKQPWHFIIIDTPELRTEILRSYPRQWLENVPVFIIACGNHSEAWHRPDGKDHTDIDIAIAVEHICLAATAAGLGTCWICNFDRKILSDALNLPDHIEPIAIIPVAYPDTADMPAAEKKRKSLEEIVQWGKF